MSQDFIGRVPPDSPDYHDPLQRLFRACHEDLAVDANGPNVKKMLEEYAASGALDWRDYARFCKLKYARNLVNKSDLLELIVLCWRKDQVSAIHNHAGQHCWAACLEGSMKEQQFTLNCGCISECKSSNCTSLKEGSTSVLSKGQCAYIDDGIALHQLGSYNGSHGVTLHLYSKVIEKCNVYCKETGVVTKRQLGYYSVGKMLEPGETEPMSYDEVVSAESAE